MRRRPWVGRLCLPDPGGEISRFSTLFLRLGGGARPWPRGTTAYMYDYDTGGVH
jgi:hypothetical protein